MAAKTETTLAPRARDPFAMFRHMTTELDRAFEGWPFMRVPLARFGAESANWTPKIEVFERDKRLVTKVDLPGMRKEDVKVEVTDGHLAIFGERKSETEEKKDRFYRCEREYGSFYRSVPLPEGAKLDEIKASFADGVLEVSVPLPAVAEAKVRQVAIQETPKAAKTAA